MPDLTQDLRAAVQAAGIDLVGVTLAEPLPTRPEVYAHTQLRDVLADARAVVVAGFCGSAWALGRIGGMEAKRLLKSARAMEEDPMVAGEIKQSLNA